MDPGKFAQFAIVWEVSACVRLYVFVTFCLFNAYACVYVYAFIYVYIIKLYIYNIYTWSPSFNWLLDYHPKP